MILTKLKNTEQHYVDILHTKSQPNQAVNEEARIEIR